METVSEGEIMMKSVAARRRGDEQRGRGEGREWDVEGSGRREGSPLFQATTRPLWALWSSPLFASASLYRHFILLRLIAAIKHYTETLQRKRKREKERKKEKEKERERKSRENRPDLTVALHCMSRVYSSIYACAALDKHDPYSYVCTFSTILYRTVEVW